MNRILSDTAGEIGARGDDDGIQLVAEAGRLKKGKQTRETITCTAANTDYPAVDAIPAGTKRLVVWADELSVIAVDEATSATVGMPIPAKTPVNVGFVLVSGGSGKVHAQSPSAGANVYITYLED